MDAVATLLAAQYGLFMGSYPVPIKTPRVLAADVHPIVFQCYKSAWVMLTGFLFAIPVYAQGKQLHLTWWAIPSAACWVPSGTCTIASVMLNGVSLSIVLNSASAAVGTFLVFWLVLDSPIKKHMIGGHEVVLAPVWLAGCVLGMIFLVYGPFLPAFCRRKFGSTQPRSVEVVSPIADMAPDAGNPLLVDAVDGGSTDKRANGSIVQFVLGVFLAVLAGLCGAAQYAVISIGRAYEERKAGCCGVDAGCVRNQTACPVALTDAFNPLGSWSFTFGLGAAFVATVLLGLLGAYRLATGQALPSLELEVMRVPGSAAGLLWVVGNLGGELSVLNKHGGNAIEVPTMTAIQLIVSGAWGIIWYREVRGWSEIAVWVLAALWTLAMVLLLGMERSK